MTDLRDLTEEQIKDCLWRIAKRIAAAGSPEEREFWRDRQRPYVRELSRRGEERMAG